MKYKLSTLNSQLSTFNSQLSTLLLVVFFALPLRAQVTIGAQAEPHSFSLLELVAKAKAGGLLLPQLKNSERDALVSASSSIGDKTAAKGLTIYNTESGCLEFWNGDDWISICNSNVNQLGLSCIAPPAEPLAITGPKVVSLKSTGSVTYSISAVRGATNYTWTLPAGWEIVGGDNNSITTESISITAIYNSGSMNGSINVRSNNDCGNSTTCILPVTVVEGCGAYIAPGVWKEFMCWNLKDNKSYNADPFTPDAGLNGDYYQWGGTTAAALSAAPPGAVGGWNSAYPATWYGSGTANVVSTDKSDYDPCPAGFRVPNVAEWKQGALGIFKNNTIEPVAAAGSVWGDNPSNWTGIMVGDVLFLPAAGMRSDSNGALTERAYSGNYWTSTLNSLLYAEMAGFNINLLTGGMWSQLRAYGYTIRCIEE